MPEPLMGQACAGKNKHGEPCGRPRRKDSQWCDHHDRTPTRGRQTVGNRSRIPYGGRPRSPEQVEAVLRWAGAAVALGELDPQTARETVHAFAELHKAMQNRLNLERQLRALERKLDKLTTGRNGGGKRVAT
jgi:hypothetical protein